MRFFEHHRLDAVQFVMKPVFHPAAEDVTVEGILHALSDPVRARIFADIAKATCAKSCSALLGACEAPVPKSTLSLHFKVLRESGLIRSVRRGVELQNSPRTDLGERFCKLISAIMEAHAAQTSRQKSPKRARAKR